MESHARSAAICALLYAQGINNLGLPVDIGGSLRDSPQIRRSGGSQAVGKIGRRE
jgi:hypothetical protein